MYIRTKKRNERKIKNTNKGKIANDNRRVYSNKYGNKKEKTGFNKANKMNGYK